MKWFLLSLMLLNACTYNSENFIVNETEESEISDEEDYLNLPNKQETYKNCKPQKEIIRVDNKTYTITFPSTCAKLNWEDPGLPYENLNNRINQEIYYLDY